MEPDLTKVQELATVQKNLPGSVDEVTALAKSACEFVRSYSWCNGIARTLAGIVIPGVVGVFLHRIIPARQEVDDWVWSIVGDLPPAYITLDDAPNPASALDAYIGAMKEWAEAVRLGGSVEELIPVNVPPEPEFADMLDSRLDYLTRMLENDYAADLEEG